MNCGNRTRLPGLAEFELRGPFFRPIEILCPFDIGVEEWDKRNVKAAKTVVEMKTPGTLIVEKYRPRMNKLTAPERQRLRYRAMQFAFGRESEISPAPTP